MKEYQNHLTMGLLLASVAHSMVFTPTISTALIIFSLACLTGFNIHISRQTTLKYNKEALDSMKNEFENLVTKYKESNEKRFSKLEDEAAKMALNAMPTKTASPLPHPRKMVF